VEAVTGYAPDALLLAVMLVGVWLVVTVVRYVRADRGTRVSMRQAARVRWGWVRLARMAGLTVTDKTPGLLAQITAQKGSTPPPEATAGARRRRRPAALCSIRPLTLPSTTAVTSHGSPPTGELPFAVTRYRSIECIRSTMTVQPAPYRSTSEVIDTRRTSHPFSMPSECVSTIRFAHDTEIDRSLPDVTSQDDVAIERQHDK
jgi:hypothetical protein